jgi:hypothetical protein
MFPALSRRPCPNYTAIGLEQRKIFLTFPPVMHSCRKKQRGNTEVTLNTTYCSLRGREYEKRLKMCLCERNFYIYNVNILYCTKYVSSITYKIIFRCLSVTIFSKTSSPIKTFCLRYIILQLQLSFALHCCI